jgi:RNA polymerase sigma factor (sigma-70 family)
MTTAAEDAVQEASLRIWRAWGRWDSALGTREAWATTILINVVRDARRAHVARYDTWCRLVALWPGEVRRRWLDPESVACNADAVERAWVHLTAREREWVTLLALGYTYTETARRCGLPSGTLKTNLHAMRRRLSASSADSAAVSRSPAGAVPI